MTENELKYRDIEKVILELSKKENIKMIKIPNWESVNISDGLKWICSTIYEGYYVKWRIVNIPGNKLIELLNWEYGENEPDFP